MGTTRFLNVDLELRGRAGLARLVGHLRSRAVALHETEDFASFETSAQHSTPEAAIRELVGIAQALPPDLASIWRACDSRVFSIGYQAGSEPRSVEHGLLSETIAAVAEIGAGIAIVVYAATD